MLGVTWVVRGAALMARGVSRVAVNGSDRREPKVIERSGTGACAITLERIVKDQSQCNLCSIDAGESLIRENGEQVLAGCAGTLR